ADEHFRSTLTDLPRPVGWLSRDEAGWACRFVAPVEGSAGELVVALPQGERGAWKAVGAVLDVAGKLVPSDPTHVAEGRLVFLRRPPVEPSGKPFGERADAR